MSEHKIDLVLIFAALAVFVGVLWCGTPREHAAPVPVVEGPSFYATQERRLEAVCNGRLAAVVTCPSSVTVYGEQCSVEIDRATCTVVGRNTED